MPPPPVHPEQCCQQCNPDQLPPIVWFLVRRAQINIFALGGGGGGGGGSRGKLENEWSISTN